VDRYLRVRGFFVVVCLRPIASETPLRRKPSEEWGTSAYRSVGDNLSAHWPTSSFFDSPEDILDYRDYEYVDDRWNNDWDDDAPSDDAVATH